MPPGASRTRNEVFVGELFGEGGENGVKRGAGARGRISDRLSELIAKPSGVAYRKIDPLKLDLGSARPARRRSVASSR